MNQRIQHQQNQHQSRHDKSTQPVKPETPAEQPATEPVVSDNNGVKTGDSYHMVWYIAAMTLTAGIACVELKRKKTFDK